ncbi:hypothetical protein J1N35_011604 [Gossypium stocksii]|uniref:CCHC-type domain-containing protein n=1 Tax=Gossypium stocksii TaxID=47602 RepID=A0A9D4ADR1_9ROSI|nr:hypothetical protein J1N35_011604 [Gossypium stocksii]
MPWLFDNCLISMLAFEKGKDINTYEFWKAPFWLRVYNFPLELMDRQMVVEVRNAIGELVVIDWKDQNGGWTEFMRLKIKIDVSKPLRRIVKVVSLEGTETIGLIRYERLPDFCYRCGIIGHTMKKCQNKREGEEVIESNFQYGSWMRAINITSNQDKGLRRNGVELVRKETKSNDDQEGSETNIRDESGQMGQKEREKGGEEDSTSTSHMEKRSHKLIRDSMGGFKHKRKRMRAVNGDRVDEGQSKSVKRSLLDCNSPNEVVAGDQPRQEP